MGDLENTNIMSLTTKIEGGVAYITLNRPEKFNSVNRELALGLQQFLDECMRDDNVRSIYLTGAGKAFCAGQDLAEVVDPDGPELKSIVHGHYNPIIERIRGLAKPVVAAVNGVAAGAGANIALACDIVVASEHASFIQAFSKIGLIPDSGGTFFLPRLIGFQKALAIAMLGDKIDAVEAEKLGMIYKYFPADTFEASSKAIAQQLATMPTFALGQTKFAYQASMTNTLDKQLALEEQYQTMCGEKNDFSEGVNAFLEKRKPIFSGK